MIRPFAILLLATAPLAAQTVPRYTIEQFMRTTRMGGSSFGPDEASLLFHSNRSGVFNVHEIAITGGPDRQITSSTTDAMFVIGYFPNDRRMLFQSDRGGDENTHIYLREMDGSTRDLTPGDSVKSEFFTWFSDDRGFAFINNGRDRRYFDLFEMDLATFTPRQLFRDTTGLTAGAISADRRWMALTKDITTQNNEMYLRDGNTGEIRHISRHTGNALFYPVDFTADGRWLYYTSDEDAEFASLRRLELATGRTETVERADWDVSFAYFSKRQKYLVVGINNDARTEIRLYDESAGHRRIELPTVPEGQITGVNISPSERRLAFYINGDRSPSNLHVYDLQSRRLTRLTSSMNPEVDPQHLVGARVVRYPSFDNVQIPSLLYQPHGATRERPAPAVLWIHGGPGGQTRFGYNPLVQYLVNHGYAVVGINNRGSSGYGKTFFGLDDRRHGEADLDDVVWSKRYLATLGWVDTGRVAILGGSYGGYMTLAGLAFRPTAFAAGVDLFGISNWFRTLRSIPPYWEAFRQALYAELGDPATDSVRLMRISPLFHADQIQRPLMVLQGANDPRVLKAESDEIVAAVRRRGGVAEYIVFDNEGHGFVNRDNEIRGYRSILEFLDRHVKGGTVP